MSRVAYKLELSAKLKIYSVFHASCLKPYHADMEDPQCRVSKRPNEDHDHDIRQRSGSWAWLKDHSPMRHFFSLYEVSHKWKKIPHASLTENALTHCISSRTRYKFLNGRDWRGCQHNMWECYAQYFFGPLRRISIIL